MSRTRMERLVARYCREEPMTDAERAEVEHHLMHEEEETRRTVPGSARLARKGRGENVRKGMPTRLGTIRAGQTVRTVVGGMRGKVRRVVKTASTPYATVEWSNGSVGRHTVTTLVVIEEGGAPVANDYPDRAELRHVMRWWRATHPDRNVRVISHPWHGWVLWTTDFEAGPVAQVMDVVRDYRKERAANAAEADAEEGGNP